MIGTLLLLSLPASVLAADDPPPRSHDPRIAISLFAENPQIVTPTGIDVDAYGRVWAIESNTHFPPENYTGHPTDRVLVMTDTDGDGRCDKVVVFLDRLTHTMSVAVRPPWLTISRDGIAATTVVYLATRMAIYRCVDRNGDLVCDEQQQIVHLETAGNYPHNGLAGFAFDPLGRLFCGFGENLGEKYTIVGSDGKSLSGGGEGGNIYRCELDGTNLTQIATGFWNPHANCFDAFGRLFSVDNDADSRPPCRLMHIIPDGDYGYRFRNGRKGLHPFTSWNGEIAGTLPMVAGTGEAPSGILAYESDGLPDEYRGNLFVTSWGDHRIDRFRLKPHGASFTSQPEPLITGGENFRPVGIACAPDGSLYCTDWVLREYKLHGRGRVWRIADATGRKANQIPSGRLSPPALDNLRLDKRRTWTRLHAFDDAGQKTLVSYLLNPATPERGRLECLWSLAADPEGRRLLKEFAPKLLDGDDAVATAANWLAAEGLLPADPVERAVRFDMRFMQRMLRREESERGDPACLIAAAAVKPYHLPAAARLECESRDPFLFAQVVRGLAASLEESALSLALKSESNLPPEIRLAATLAARRKSPRATAVLQIALKDPDALVRRAAVQWAAEEGLSEFHKDVAAILDDEILSADLFLATLAALEMLDGVPPAEFDKSPPGKYVLPIIQDKQQPASIRRLALRMVPPTEPGLTASLLGELLASDDPALRLEAVWRLQPSTLPGALGLLQKIVADEEQDAEIRLDALAGLSVAAESKNGTAVRRLLCRLAVERQPYEFRREALRGLRGKGSVEVVRTALEQVAESLKEFPPNDPQTRELGDQLSLALADPEAAKRLIDDARRSPRIETADEWRSTLGKGAAASADSGRRLFYHAAGPGCSRCHTVNGRGGKIGPDLSTIGRSLSREKLIDSILEPSKEIAPQFVTWALEMKSGQVHSGMIVFENEGRLTLGTAEGQTVEFPNIDIVDRKLQEKSVMPEKLAEKMTPQEFRDLLAFLEALK